MKLASSRKSTGCPHHCPDLIAVDFQISMLCLTVIFHILMKFLVMLDEKF